MTLSELITKINEIISNNPGSGNLEVFGEEPHDHKLTHIKDIELSIVDKQNPTNNYKWDYETILDCFEEFKKGDYKRAIVISLK